MKLDYRKPVWAILAVMLAMSLVLTAFTVHNYTEIAKAKIFTSLKVSSEPVYGFNETGNLESVNLSINFTLENPSRKELRLWIFGFKAWIRDRMQEDRVVNDRWGIDGEIPMDGTVMLYYPVFSSSYSFDNPEVLVAPGSELTVTRHIILNHSVDSNIMETVSEIYNYTTANYGQPEWFDYTSAIIFLTDIPRYAGPDNDANLIRRFRGFDLTPSVGGVG